MTTSDIPAGPATPRPADTARRQELLRRYLRQRTGQAEAPPRPVPRDRPLPLSFPQQRLWFLDQLRPGGTEYVAAWTWRLTGPLDAGALRAAWREVVRRHEILRTRYRAVDGEPVQDIGEPAEVDLPLTDLSGMAAGERDARVAALTEELTGEPFDLGGGAPLRLRLLRLGPAEHLLLFAVHHIAFDGWSAGVLAAELSELYPGYATGRPVTLPPLSVQYADFAVWQRNRSNARDLAHWRERLAGLVPVELPTDRPRPSTADTRGASTSFTVPARLGRAARELGRVHRATPFMVLLAVFELLLARYSGQSDIAVGTPVAGRTAPGVRELFGFFVNNLVLRADLSGDPSFLDLLAQVRTTALAAYAHQDLPFEQLVNELAPRRDLSRNPLFAHMFTVQDNATADFGGAGLHAESVPMPVRAAKFDLTMQLTEHPDGTLDGVLEYATALFDRATAERLTGHYVTLLDSVLADPAAPVHRAELLPPAERRQLVAGYNDTARAVPAATVPELFHRQALRTPDAVAVTCGGEPVRYAELAARVDELAAHLRSLGVGPGVLAGVHLDRGTDLVVAFLAVLRAGGAYLPIDPGYPAARIGFMLTDSRARVLITQDALAGRVPPFPGTTVLLDRLPAAPAPAGPGRAAGPDDLAYLIYTSGSTGTPKGVLIDHRALTNFVLAMAERPGLAPGGTVVGLTTVSFDPSVLELYLPLLTGGTLVLADPEQARDPQRMAALLDSTADSAGGLTVQATPTTWRMLLDTGWAPPAALTVLCGGEQLPAGLARRLTARGAALWDLYGPTEATVWASAARIDRTGAVADWAPVANDTAHVLDAHLAPVPAGVTGELFLGGTGIALGYHERPALTAERFLPDPFAPRPGGRLYRTGDLARREPDGSVRILGRADHQVKIHGHRMEPGEIEAALLAHDRIRAAVVHPTPTAAGELALAAYLVADGTAPAGAELRAWLLRTLPDYMVPTAWVVLDDLPRTPAGKVDRAALPAPDTVTGATRQHVLPRTPAERTVAGVWRQVLERTAVGVHENFFDLGGHSLLAGQVAIRLRTALGVDVPVRALFDHGTVAELAAALPGYPRASAAATGSVRPIRRRRRRPTTSGGAS